MLTEMLARLRGDNAHASGARVPTLFPDFPQLYEPPQDILRQLREESALVDLLYFGWGRWYLVRFKPDRRHLESGARRIREAQRMLAVWETNQHWKANPGAFKRLYGRYLLWLVVCQGGRPIGDAYDRTFIRTKGFEAIVTDFRYMEWMLRHTTTNEVTTALTADQDRGEIEARAAFADEYAAKDVCDYLNIRTHGVTRYDDPERRRQKSGSTTIAAIGADGQRRSIA